MDTVIGIILIVSFIAFAIYAMKGGNLMLGFFSLAVIWAGLGAIAGVTVWNDPSGTILDINNGIFEKGPEMYGASAAVIIFGSWFGEILVETGIARTIIKKAVELGGDRPALTCSLLTIIVAIIFCTAYGVGAVIAIGAIVFPILLSLGIPKPLAAGSFLMAVGAGLFLNNSWFSLFTNLFDGLERNATYTTFAFIAFGLQVLATILMIVITSKRQKISHAWAADISNGDSNENTEKSANFLACLTPLLAPALSIAFKVAVIPSILIAVIWALFWTGYLKKWGKLGSTVQKNVFKWCFQHRACTGNADDDPDVSTGCEGLRAVALADYQPDYACQCDLARCRIRDTRILCSVPWAFDSMGRWRCDAGDDAGTWYISDIRAIPAVFHSVDSYQWLCLPDTVMVCMVDWIYQGHGQRILKTGSSICPYFGCNTAIYWAFYFRKWFLIRMMSVGCGQPVVIELPDGRS